MNRTQGGPGKDSPQSDLSTGAFPEEAPEFQGNPGSRCAKALGYEEVWENGEGGVLSEPDVWWGTG